MVKVKEEVENWSKTVDWSIMVENSQNWTKIVNNWSNIGYSKFIKKWSKIVKNDQKLVANGQFKIKYLKTGQIGQNLFKNSQKLVENSKKVDNTSQNSILV
jgi:hypothetical protein